MCGFCGLFTPDGAAGGPEFARAASEMSKAMERRGPDADGEWLDAEHRARFAFRRLRVIDTSTAADQPMTGEGGRSAIVLNGEIYNFRELRSELEGIGHRFRTQSDTEVLLGALAEWGHDALPRLNGMFAFAWYSGITRTLMLGRDHAGMKPLYYFVPPGGVGLAFASRYDALACTPWGRPGSIKADVLHLYLRLQHLPAPYALLSNTHQLEPGHTLSIDSTGRMEKRCWWQLPADPEPDLRGEPARRALAAALDGAISRHRIADVPLGVFLSGGVDSPLIAAIASDQAGPQLGAFVLGNPGWDQDEGPAAERYGGVLGLQVQRCNVSGDLALEVLDEVREAQYEPFADFSILPSLLLSKMARKSVTVVLSGDGGDELFFGYERPASLLRNGAEFGHSWTRRALKYAIGRVGLGKRQSDAILHQTVGDYYFSVNSRMSAQDVALLAPGLPPIPHDFHMYESPPYKNPLGLANYSRKVEFAGQLQRGLKKMDMASMHHSLEVRVPMLDKEVIDVSLRIDPFDSLSGGQRKRVLRDLLAEHVPREVIPEAKRGFSVPLGEWLRGPLRLAAEQAIKSPALLGTGMFDRRGLDRYWQAHLRNERDLKWGIWTLMTLSWWLERNA